MKNKLEERLRKYKRTYITLDELINFYQGSIEYDIFVEFIKDLENRGGIEPVKKSGYNNGLVPLAYKYRVNKPYFKQKYYNRLNKKQWEINSLLSLESYYALDESIFSNDEPYINLISKYIYNYD
ncbi:MAG: hypothetical protein N4A50_08055 [Vallitalea sp.]|nr:hypothetical protein [Vallitalea sp.]